jgi:integrase
MSSLYKAAMQPPSPIVLYNPFAGLDPPEVEPQPVFFYEPSEAVALYAAAGEVGDQWRVMVELGMQAGLRFEDLAGLHGQRVDWLRHRLEVVDVMTRAGLRQWPKSRKSHRTAPLPPGLLEDMSRLMAGRDRTGLVFTAPEGGPVNYSNFRTRVWYPAVAAAGVRVYPPRVMRHTAASWLVQDGVPLYDVQALLGHESFATTQRLRASRAGRAQQGSGVVEGEGSAVTEFRAPPGCSCL